MILRDKIMLRQFRSHNRNSILQLVTGRQRRFSASWFRQAWYRLLLIGASNKGLFTLIHDKNLWNEKESVSGPGSTFEITKNIRAKLPELFEKYNIQSMLDIPCGDFNWMQFVEMKGIEYIGADIVDELIEKNKLQFSSSHRSFRVLNLVKDPLPETDLILCRDGLVHLSDREIKKALKNIKKSGTKYLLATSFTERECNLKHSATHWRPINFRLSPFHFPEALLIIKENEENEQFSDKSLCLWAIKDL